MDEYANRHMVGVQGDKIVIMLPPHALSKREALVFAAWLVTLAQDGGNFLDICEKVQNQ